ncbi:MAG: hypothetical protein EOP59_16230 [Sphingomonadales bacterium]|nr:MAG: hypothetical protein EOP59_16230 [Sphingomonadales bacterium]
MFARHWRDWLARFLPAELLGLAGSYCGYLLCAHLGLPPALAAYGAAMGENCGYYTAVFARDWFALAPEERAFGRVTRAMLHDFGLAEVLDTLVVRPGATLLAVTFLGTAIGIAVGKFAADAVFYVLAISFWERRRARERKA